MIKSLFLTFQPIKKNDGISQKILNERNSLRHCGFDIDLGFIDWIDNEFWFKIENRKVKKYGKSINSWKIGCRYYWRDIYNYIVTNNYDFIYIRYTHFASPWTVNLIRKLHSANMKLFLEIPTYPYDAEYVNRKGILENLAIQMERVYRSKLGKYLDRIITFSTDKYIWGCPTIQISNGVSMESIPKWEKKSKNKNTLKLIGVAAFSEWHGYDRLLRGLANYINSNDPNIIDVKVELIGPHNETCLKLIELSKQLGIESNVIFPGSMSGPDLDNRFNNSDIAIGSLGRHRSGIKLIRTLKNREYASRAIPFVYSESDPDFDNKEYVLKVPADESPININNLIEFAQKEKPNLSSSREYVEKNLTWDSQMRIIKNHFDKL